MTLFRTTQTITMLCALLSASVAYGQDTPQPVQIMPDDIKWTSLPVAPGVQIAWLIGAADKPGFYELRVRMAPGSILPPHTHPDNRHLTVLSGELYVGFGNTFEPEKTKRFPAGSFLAVPAGTVHYVLAKNGEVVFDDAAIGPTGTNWIKK